MIRQARADELTELRELERAADQAFAKLGMDAIAGAEPTAIEALVVYAGEQRAWVSVDRADRPIAFLLLDVVDRAAHVQQVSVDPRSARHGIGAGLLDAAARWAARQRLSAVTLITFRDVPWNCPYYERLGFRIVEYGQITPGLRRLRARETELELDRWPRVVMRRGADAVVSACDPAGR